MRRATAEHNTFDGGLAIAARFAGAIVDAVQLLVCALHSVSIHIVAQCAAAMAECAAERQFDGTIQSADLIIAQFICWNERVELREEKGFVGVDIADAGEHCLIEQDIFDGPVRASQSMG